MAAIYDSYIPAENRVQLDAGGQGMRMTYHQYWVRCSDRAGLHRALDKAGVDVGIYYDPPLHRHELAVYCRAAGALPEAERAGREILTLPIHAALPFEDAHRVGAVVREFMSASGGHGA
ncbi:MAG: DegT/DnrJ/EryC1/StrS family aminotransferase [bacterium]|nr:DegT/DnrJ/EryC1/StrS family aminotransferase [bacterium]